MTDARNAPPLRIGAAPGNSWDEQFVADEGNVMVIEPETVDDRLPPDRGGRSQGGAGDRALYVMIQYRHRLNPRAAGALFTQEPQIAATTSRLQREGFMVVWVRRPPAKP